MQICSTFSEHSRVMNRNAVAIKLLTFLASGGTIERLHAELPLSKNQIDSAFEWLRSGGRCEVSEVVARANRLREFTVQKRDAIKRNDFDLAARNRDQERSVYESFRLAVPTRESCTIVSGDLAEQIKILGGMLRDADAACQPNTLRWPG